MSMKGGDELNTLLTIEQLRSYYNVSRNTVYIWLKQGIPVVLLPSGYKRFDIEKVNEWINAKGAK